MSYNVFALIISTVAWKKKKKNLNHKLSQLKKKNVKISQSKYCLLLLDVFISYHIQQPGF